MAGATLLMSEVFILLLLDDQFIRDLLICTVLVLLVTVGSPLLLKHVSMRSVSILILMSHNLYFFLGTHSTHYKTSINLETNLRRLTPRETFSEIKPFVILSHCKKSKTSVLQRSALEA